MYWVNKIVWMVVNPLSIGLVLVAFASLAALAETVSRNRRFALFARRAKCVLLPVSFLWFWCWGMPAWTRIVGGMLEREYLVDGEAGLRMKRVDEYPSADAIIDLGGGCGASTNAFPLPLLNAGADRAYFSSMLWKTGKAPFIIPSGTGMEFSDMAFITDLGVPESAVLIEDKARNTEENAKRVAALLKKQNPSVLLVTSAWHMKRSMLMFEKYAPGVTCIPAACDFESDVCFRLTAKDFFPDPGAFERNCRFAHEWIGIIWYRWIRR